MTIRVSDWGYRSCCRPSPIWRSLARPAAGGMKPVNGIQVTREIAESSPDTRTIILSVHDDAGYVTMALREGARGYVLKESGIDVLVMAIQQVMAGSVYLCPALKGDGDRHR